MRMPAFIEDGYEIHYGLKEIPGVRAAIEAVRRPFCGGELSQASNDVYALDGEERSNKMAEVLAETCQSWNLTGPKGEPVPVEVRWLKKMEGGLQKAMFDIQMGVMVPDYIMDDDGNKIDPTTAGDDIKN